MDTLGFSTATRSLAESDRRGLWPPIMDNKDAEYWIYSGAGMVFAMAVHCIVLSTAKGNPASAAIEASFLILGAAGIVCGSRIATVGALGALVLFLGVMSRYNPYAILGLAPACLFIIHAARSVWFLNRTRQSLPSLNRNWFLNAVAGSVPKAVWRAGRLAFYALAAACLPWLVYRMFVPIAPGAKWRGAVEFPWM